MAGIGLLGLFLGWWRFEVGLKPISPGQIRFYNNEAAVQWRGAVVGEPDARVNQIKLTMAAREIFLDGQWRKIGGKVLVSVGLYPGYEYGDNLELKCKLETPERIDNFDYQAYLERYGVGSLCAYPKIVAVRGNTGEKWYAAILKFKTRSVELINRNLPEPQAGILGAMLLGNKRGVPKEWTQIFQRVGTTHIIAISGAHINLIVAIVMAVLLGAGVSRKLAFYVVTIFLVGFVILIGAPAAAVRAGIMGFLVLWALKIGRLQHSGGALLLVAVLMLFINPQILRADTGFQLSCLAVAGLIWLRPLLMPWFKWVPEILGLRESLIMSLAAQITTWPLLTFGMGKTSLIGLVANLAIVPAATWILTTGLVGLALALALPFLASVAFWPAWLGLTYMMKAGAWFATCPWGYWERAQSSSLGLALGYLILLLLTLVGYNLLGRFNEQT